MVSNNYVMILETIYFMVCSLWYSTLYELERAKQWKDKRVGFTDLTILQFYWWYKIIYFYVQKTQEPCFCSWGEENACSASSLDRCIMEDAFRRARWR